MSTCSCRKIKFKGSLDQSDRRKFKFYKNKSVPSLGSPDFHPTYCHWGFNHINSTPSRRETLSTKSFLKCQFQSFNLTKEQNYNVFGLSKDWSFFNRFKVWSKNDLVINFFIYFDCRFSPLHNFEMGCNFRT